MLVVIPQVHGEIQGGLQRQENGNPAGEVDRVMRGGHRALGHRQVRAFSVRDPVGLYPASSEVLEPEAGRGSFSRTRPRCVARLGMVK